MERPLGYFSRKLHAVETRYPAYDRELLAISANLEHWACYVHGRKRTTIYTDHAALQHILEQNKLTSRQWRHLDKLQQHDYEVKYFPGAANVVADALSRIAYTKQAEPRATLGVADTPSHARRGRHSEPNRVNESDRVSRSSQRCLRSCQRRRAAYFGICGMA